MFVDLPVAHLEDADGWLLPRNAVDYYVRDVGYTPIPIRSCCSAQRISQYTIGSALIWLKPRNTWSNVNTCKARVTASFQFQTIHALA